jgi:nitroreductase
MNVKEAIDKRRAYRSLEPVEITIDLIHDLAHHAILAPSCFNNQPVRYIFVYNKEKLMQLREALSKGNEWAYDASMIIAVFGQKDTDCIIADREYYLFDLGLSTAFLVLRATEMGLVAHPIAGFKGAKTKEILGIPKDMMVITLVIVGKHSDKISPALSEKQIGWEKERPERLPFEKFAYLNSYGNVKA